ncbi:MAG: BMP family ABC transporter substrate-binding protein [Actinobacteria bacterium]|nr:BMP family ABC transporter substrate-binding protein [Actinomycetota bacterium]
MRLRIRFGMALVLSFALVAAACGEDEGTPGMGGTPGEEPPRVGMVYDIGGRGDLSFNDAAAAGLDKSTADFEIQAEELEPNQGGTNRGELLRLLAEQDFSLIIGVGFLFAQDICATALEFPDVSFADVDGFIDATTCDGAEDLTEESNVTSLLFAEEQGSFLVGAAAALKSETGHIGFIGGVEIDLIKKFQAGYEAGARQINPDIEIDVQYISQPPDFSGFGDPARGQEIAAGMYDNGADVVYHAAGGSGSGLFQAAVEKSEETGTQLWAIGVDSDQYQSAPPEQQPHILTSMLKRVDVAVYETIGDFVGGNLTGGYRTFDLSVDGVGYSPSGGFLDDVTDQLEDLKQQIIDGEIEVPTTPEG